MAELTQTQLGAVVAIIAVTLGCYAAIILNYMRRHTDTQRRMFRKELRNKFNEK